MLDELLKDLHNTDEESRQMILDLVKRNEFITPEELRNGVMKNSSARSINKPNKRNFLDYSNQIAEESLFGKQSIFYKYRVTINAAKNKILEKEDELFTNLIACESGSEVFEKYNNDQTIADNEMNIYYEEEKTGKANFFGIACRVRMGKNFRIVLDKHDFNIVVTNFNVMTTSLRDFVSKIATSHHISSSLLEMAIRIEFLEKSLLNQTFQQVLSVNNYTAEFIKGGIETLENYKFTEENYDYQKYFLDLRNNSSKNYPYKPILPIKAFMTEGDRMYSRNAQNFVTNGLKNLTGLLGSFEELITGIGYYFLKKTKELAQDVVEAVIFLTKQLLEKVIPDSVKVIFKRVKNFISKIANAIEKVGPLIKNQLGHDLALANAFLCGLINGLISLVQTILMLLALLIDKFPLLEIEKGALPELVKHQEKLEFIEDTVDLLEEKGSHLVDSIKILVTNTKIWKELRRFFGNLKDEVANLNEYFWAFFAGAVIFEILLEVVLAIFTGGGGNLANLSSKISRISTKAEQLAAKTTNFVTKLASQVKNSLNQLIKWLRKELDEFVEAVKSGKFIEYIKRKFENLFNDEPQRKNKKHFDNFKEKWKGKSTLKLSKTEIANALKGYTEQGNKIAKLIEEGKMKFQILDDANFEKMLMDSGDTLEEARQTVAFCIDDKTFYRASTPADKLLSEFVHEGTHALDYENGFVGDTYQWEKRAFFHERAFQEAVGLEKDFDTIREMLDFIYINY